MSLSSSSPAGWTGARVAQLRTLWRDGQSATTVARALGVSRNAIIGKVHRLGLSRDGRHAAAQVRPPKRPRARGWAPRVLRSRRLGPSGPVTRPAAIAAEPLTGLAPCLEQLGARACRWPIGDPRAADFAFCGRPAPVGPYCGPHDAVAHGRPVGAAP